MADYTHVGHRRWIVGFVLAAFLCFGATVPATAEADGQAIVNAAASQAGVPYCWAGGNELGATHGVGGSGCGGSTVGFDCTGLAIYAVYQGTGISGLPHDGEGDRWAAKGTRINDQSQLQPGDIVFFGGSFSSFEHAAIYAGGGMTWDADDFNVPVQQHSLSWIEHALPFVGAVRFGGSGSGGSSGFSDGSFVSNNGFVYRIAGGAPVYVSNWNAVGGPQPTTALTDAQFAALPAYPRDGTILDASGGGVFIVAGGAPMYLSNWNAIGGPKPGVGVDEAAIDNAGGGNPWNHLRAYPADGTLISSTATGMVYEIAGGAPLYVSTWNAIGGPRPVVGIDQWDLENTSNPAAHLLAYPANATMISTTQDGRVYRIAGGAPLYVSSWNAVGGPQPTVTVDQWDVDNTADPHAHLRPYPADGTFINTSESHVYRFAGGAPFLVNSWSVFGGTQPSTRVDHWDVDNASDPHAHVRSAPANGTTVEGLPSQSYWSFNAGYRSRTAASGSAVPVDDAGLATYPQTTTGVSGSSGGSAGSGGGASGPGGSVWGGGGSRPSAACVVPRLRHMTVKQARSILHRSYCRLGWVHRPRHVARQHVLRVVSQSARPGSRHQMEYGVNITLR